MKVSIRSAVIAGLGVGGVVIATAANATNVTVPLPSSGSSDLLFFVNDTSSGTTYTRVLTETVASLFSYASAPAGTAGAIVGYNGDAGFTVNTGADSSLVNFISNAESNGDTLQWGVIAGAYTTPTSTPGNAVALATASNYASGIYQAGLADQSIEGVATSTLSNTMLSTGSGLGKDITKLVSKTQDAWGNATTQGIFGTSSSQSGTNLTFYGAGVNMSGLSLGTSSSLYAMTASPLTNTYDYRLGTITLSANGQTLTFAGNSAVPLPAAVWLLGSGLLGLAGIGRRRAVKTEAT